MTSPLHPTLRRLRDCIRPGVRVLFVGINPGIRSATIGHHFAGYSNRFWKLLYDAGLVSQPITCEEDGRLPDWGYGLTNLVARASPGVGDLSRTELVAGKGRLLAKVRRWRPQVVALVGVTVYTALFPRPKAPRENGASPAAKAIVGLRPETLAGVPVFVLPNPSGRNANFSYQEMLAAFRALKAYLDLLA